MNQKRIAITGVGLVTPLGIGCERTWRGIVRGTSAIRWLSPEELGASQVSDDHRLWYGGRVDEALTLVGNSRSTSFALLAAEEALQQACLSLGETCETACVIGTSKPELRSIDSLIREMPEPSELAWEELSVIFPSHPAQQVAARLGLRGPALCPVAACATGLVSLIRAAELIRHGEATSVLAGSTDSSLHPGLLSSYRRLGVLAPPGQDPATACRPFDRHRSGFVVGGRGRRDGVRRLGIGPSSRSRTDRGMGGRPDRR